LQTLAAQSLPPVHVLPVAHFEQVPPQSTSLSAPFLTASLQAAATHLLLVQTPLAQWLPALQVCPVVQRPHVDVPPQSTSLSPPFRTRSVHVAF
jgi:hypothetical protein